MAPIVANYRQTVTATVYWNKSRNNDYAINRSVYRLYVSALAKAKPRHTWMTITVCWFSIKIRFFVVGENRGCKCNTKSNSWWWKLVKSLHSDSTQRAPHSLFIVLASCSALFMKIKATQDLKVKSKQKLTVPKGWGVFNWHFCLCPLTIRRRRENSLFSNILNYY